MKIATWNVERLKHRASLDKLLQACERVRADILVLTETDDRLRPDYPYWISTLPAAELSPKMYRPTERRVSVFTRYPCIRQYPTFDPYTAVCVELETDRGALLVYGTVMGVFGNRHPAFREDLVKQCEDFARLCAGQKDLCICGDWNQSFGDNYYYTCAGRDSLRQTLAKYGIRLLTGDRSECIDHIAVSESFAGEASVEIEEWNKDKALSDHKGISVAWGR